MAIAACLQTQAPCVGAYDVCGLEFPIEVEFPDIRRWRPGNVGLDYVWSFAGDAPGPHLAVVALVHGNEFCGAISLDRLLARFVEGRLRPRQGRVSFILANPEAYLAFDPQRPLASRALDEDMNRLWDAHTLESARTSRELARARALRPRIDTVDHLIDLHSMSLPSPPLVLAGDTAKGVALARACAAVRHPDRFRPCRGPTATGRCGLWRSRQPQNRPAG
ncbi:MAG: succinylglutamate desuccinylase/aspartoacylase family protein [Casimicrobiaceae bacterium]|nr:succinylglutamate desuccinylase/aspartoacylase family protein [Casimicrobiaceae bacterium]